MKPYPPLLYGAGLLLALAGHLVHPLSLPGAWWLRALGVVLVILAAGLAGAADREMGRAKTTVMPFQDASALVTSGPFRLTRNPIYLGFAIATCGVALATASWWPVIVLPVVVVTMTVVVIRGEERRLQRLFGEAYAGYRRRVRRWI